MEKIKFVFDDTKDEVEFFVLEQTKVNGNSYILVTDSEEDEAECLILKDTSAAEDVESLYEVVEDENELMGVLKVFEELLEDLILICNRWLHFEGALCQLTRKSLKKC